MLSEEEIAYFKTQALYEYLNTHKGVFYDRDLWGRILSNLKFGNRFYIEGDPRYRQVITFIVIKKGELFLVYERLQDSEEKDPRGKWSIGFGGHINKSDIEKPDSISWKSINDVRLFVANMVLREIKEKIKITPEDLSEPRLVGFINDESDSVGECHFGVVWYARVRKTASLKKSKEISRIRWEKLVALRNKNDRFENWSQLLIDFFWRKRKHKLWMK
jgi:predicted NUDIX family phosphoesterase